MSQEGQGASCKVWVGIKWEARRREVDMGVLCLLHAMCLQLVLSYLYHSLLHLLTPQL